jgi:transcriptional regulator with XRE-family HTH domain
MDIMINGVRFVAERTPTNLKMQFHELIKTARKQNMETIEEAAQAIGTTKSRIYELEQGGAMPRLPLLQKILKHYGLSFDQIAEH